MTVELETHVTNPHAELEATLDALGLETLLDRPALGAWNGHAEWPDTG